MIIAGVFLLGAVQGFIKGLVRQVASLVGLVAGLLIARALFGAVGAAVKNSGSMVRLRGPVPSGFDGENAGFSFIPYCFNCISQISEGNFPFIVMTLRG